MAGISPLGANSAASTAGASAAGRTKDGKAAFGKDVFLSLLVAQLKYQDPTKPADSTQFMAQTAQFTMVEKLEELAKTNSQLLASQQVVGTSALLGRSVTYLGSDGTTATGVVTAANFGGTDGPTLRVGDKDVPLARITKVAPPS